LKGLITLLLIVFFGWCFGSTYWYVCKIKGLCAEDSSSVVELPVEEERPKPGNLLFSRSNPAPETNNGTMLLIDSLRRLNADTLIITGKYFSDEERGEALGLDRAKKVLTILQNNGYKGATSLSTSMVQSQLGDDKLRAVDFRAITNPVEESEGGFTFTTTDTKIIINFPVASADPHGDERLINQLKDFAQRAVADGSKITVSGHTDNTGTHDANVYYGQLRADVISKLLVEYGMNAKNIDAISKGESEPLATNETNEGRRQNRRVEIEIISN